MLDLLAMARQKGSDDRLRAQMLASIGIVCSTSDSGICFVVTHQLKQEHPHSEVLEVQMFDLCCSRLSIRRFQVLKLSFQEVLSSRVRGKAHWLFLHCVCHTLREKCGSDTHTMQRAIAGHVACITKTVSCWTLLRWCFHEFSLLVFIQWHFAGF